MRNFYIHLAVFIALVALILGATPTFADQTSCTPPTPVAATCYPVNEVQPGAASNSKYQIEGKLVFGEPRPFGLFADPFVWRIFGAKETSGSLRLYFESSDKKFVHYVDTQNIDAIKSYFNVKELTSLRNRYIITDTDPSGLVDAVCATYSEKGQKLAKALAKALVNCDDRIDKENTITEELHPLWGLDEVFLSDTAIEVASQSDNRWTLRPVSIKERSDYWKSHPTSDTLLLMVSKTGCQRVVIHVDGKIDWLDPRLLTPAEMSLIDGKISSETPNAAVLQKAGQITVQGW